MIQLPAYSKLLWKPRRYKVLYGGRGGSKSHTVAKILLILGTQSKRFVLCGREFQNSISESVHRLLVGQINLLGLDGFYKANNQSIQGANGTEFIFKGVKQNVESIKSIPGITDLWLEEAQAISKESWDILIPTIREETSEIWATFNPENEDDPTYTMFVNPDGTPKARDDSITIPVNWRDNPWFPEVLRKEKDHLFSVDPDLAMHVWEGQCRKNSASQIFKGKWEVRAFEPKQHMDGPYYGADWGFSVDPCACVEVYIDPIERELLIRRAIFGHGIEIDYLSDFFHRIPNARLHKIRADSSRPETISHVARKGYPQLEAAEKWQGSVEDGIEWLRTWNKIVIHPDCEHEIQRDGQMVRYGMVTEAKNYSYKVDRLTGDVLRTVVDSYNHGWDAVRYACQPMIRKQASILDCF